VLGNRDSNLSCGVTSVRIVLIGVNFGHRTMAILMVSLTTEHEGWNENYNEEYELNAENEN